MSELLLYFKENIPNFKPTSCSKILLKYYLKLKERDIIMSKRKFNLKKGSLIFVSGIAYTNENLTDERAVEFLKGGLKRIASFEKPPTKWKELVKDKAEDKSEAKAKDKSDK